MIQYGTEQSSLYSGQSSPVYSQHEYTGMFQNIENFSLSRTVSVDWKNEPLFSHCFTNFH
jgi:hypothetical protein